MSSSPKSKKVDFNDLVEKLLSLEKAETFKTFHVFKREKCYSCYDYHARQIADGYYENRNVIRIDNGLECLNMNRKTLSHVSVGLLERKFTMKIWGKPEKNLSSSSWELICEATPGNYNQLEDELGFLERDTTSSSFVAGVKLDEKNSVVGLALMSTSINTIILTEFRDNEFFIRLCEIFAQYNITLCYVLQCDQDNNHHIIDMTNDSNIDIAASGQAALNRDEFHPFFHLYKRLETALKKAEVLFEYVSLPRTVQNIMSKKSKTNKNVKYNEALKTRVLGELERVCLSEEAVSGTPWKKPYDDQLAVQNTSSTAYLLSHIDKLDSALQCSLFLLDYFKVWEEAKFTKAFVIRIDEVEQYLKYNQNVNKGLNLFEVRRPAYMKNAVIADEDTSTSDPSSSSASTSPSSSLKTNLFDLINQTKTRMGGKLLKEWLQKPLLLREDILQRQHRVQQFVTHTDLLTQLTTSTACLKQFPDLKSLALKMQCSDKFLQQPSYRVLTTLIQVYRCTMRMENMVNLLRKKAQQEERGYGHRDISSVANKNTSNDVIDLCSDDDAEIEAMVVEDKTTPSTSNSAFLHFADEISSHLQQFANFQLLIEKLIDIEHIEQIKVERQQGKSVVENVSQVAEDNLESMAAAPSFLAIQRDYYRVRPDFTPELHELSKRLMDIEQKIQTEYLSVLSMLKLTKKEMHLEYSPIHSIHFRVTKRISMKVTQTFKQQKVSFFVLSNQKAGMLFVTNTAKDLVVKYQRLQNEYQQAQQEIVQQAVQVVRTYTVTMLRSAESIATLDCILSLASVARIYDWTCPILLSDQSKDMQIIGLRHPLVEQQCGTSNIIPNDVTITPQQFACIISGPNMGGKSTYLKAIGIAVMLTQMGSFLPATAARLPVFDRVFLRTGATDCARLGISSFMAETMDISEILQSATMHSLVLLDELGRGTSTADGLGLAVAILESLAFDTQCTLFCATHFHELNALAEGENVFFAQHVNAHVDDQYRAVTMLYQMLPGATNRSYGIHVAKVAKLPDEIIQEASVIEQCLEQTSPRLDICHNKKRKFDDIACDSQQEVVEEE